MVSGPGVHPAIARCLHIACEGGRSPRVPGRSDEREGGVIVEADAARNSEGSGEGTAPRTTRRDTALLYPSPTRCMAGATADPGIYGSSR